MEALHGANELALCQTMTPYVVLPLKESMIVQPCHTTEYYSMPVQAACVPSVWMPAFSEDYMRMVKSYGPDAYPTSVRMPAFSEG